MVREKKGGRGGQGEDAWYIKYANVHTQLRIIINFHKFKHHNFFIYTGFRSPSKASSLTNPSPKHMGFMRLWMQAYKPPAHFVWATIGFIEKLSVDKGQIVYATV